MDINALIKLIQSCSASGAATVNVNVINTADVVPVETSTDESYDDEDETPSTDFSLGQRVVVCHRRHDGTPVHTNGSVIEILGKDNYGWYTRVIGDNGKHYRTGVVYDQERMGSMIVHIS